MKNYFPPPNVEEYINVELKALSIRIINDEIGLMDHAVELGLKALKERYGVTLRSLRASLTRMLPPEKCSDSKDPPTRLLSFVESAEDIFVFKTPTRETFVTFPKARGDSDMLQTQPVDSVEFQAFLFELYRTGTGSLCSRDAISTVIAYLAGHAENTEPVYVRLAHHKDRVYVDLANEDCIVEISAGAWRLIKITDCPVKFWRPPGVRPIPKPERGGRLNDLRRFLNVDDKQFQKVLLFLVGSFTNGPLLVLLICGEQGTAKTTQARIIRRAIDPNECEISSQPDSTRDLLLSCRNQYCVAIDNVSRLTAAESDAHCCIATGASKRERALYTNSEEFLLSFRRPQIFTAIKDVINKSDLADRKIKVVLKPIPMEQRQSEKMLLRNLNQDLPKFLGALYDAVAGALKEAPHVNAPLTRMADACELLFALEKHLEWPVGTVVRILDDEARSDAEDSVEASAFAQALIVTVQANYNLWTAKPTEVLKELATKRPKDADERDRWPRSGKGLRNLLRELGADLRSVGLTYEQAPGGTREYTFKYASECASSSAKTAQAPETKQGSLFETADNHADRMPDANGYPPSKNSGAWGADAQSQTPDDMQPQKAAQAEPLGGWADNAFDSPLFVDDPAHEEQEEILI